MAVKAKQKRSFIDPARLYTLNGFKEAAGIDSTRIWRAKQAGVTLPTINVGRRKFVRGEDGIAYIVRLSELGEGEE